MKDLALIILNYNCFDDTRKCLEQLLTFRGEFKIIVVDNKSTDESFKKLKSLKLENENIVIIESDKNGGYSYGNNYGVKYAEKNFNINKIGILNPDVIIPDYSILKKMYFYLDEDENYAMIGGKQILPDYSPYYLSNWHVPTKTTVVLNRSYFIGHMFTNKEAEDPINSYLNKTDCIIGCFFIIKLEKFKEVGYFDEGVFLYHEEDILGIKLKNKGYTNIVAKDLEYFHNHDYRKERKNQTFKKRLNKLKQEYISRKYLIEKYYPKYLIVFLWIVEITNIFKVCLGHIKNKLRR